MIYFAKASKLGDLKAKSRLAIIMWDKKQKISAVALFQDILERDSNAWYIKGVNCSDLKNRLECWKRSFDLVYETKKGKTDLSGKTMHPLCALQLSWYCYKGWQYDEIKKEWSLSANNINYNQCTYYFEKLLLLKFEIKSAVENEKLKELTSKILSNNQ